MRRAIDLRAAHIVVRVKRLPMQVALVDHIVVDDGDVLDAASSKQPEQRRPEAACANNEDALRDAHRKYSPRLK
jgi:hypothetical protein